MTEQLIDTAPHIERTAGNRGDFPLMREMIVEPGTKGDWALLHELHYKSDRERAGQHFWRLRLGERTIGVIVTALPSGLIKERHKAFPNLAPKPGHETSITNQYRYKWLNKNMRLIARAVIDTQFRGVGAAYRFQNLVSRLDAPRFMEIQSSMSKYNFFAQKAGFKFVRPMRANAFEQGMKFFRATFDAHPADTEALVQEIESLPPGRRERVMTATRDFYWNNSAQEKTGQNLGKTRETSRINDWDARTLIKQLQQLVLASPLYGVYPNPDTGRDDLPTQLPLTAFDNQKPTEPLVTEGLWNAS